KGPVGVITITGTPGGGGIVKRFVQVVPPSIDCQSGAFPFQPPENATITISFGFSGLTAIVGSVSGNISFGLSVGSVLLTTMSRTNIGAVASERLWAVCSRCCSRNPGGCGVGVGLTIGFRSSGIAGRTYGVKSGGKLLADSWVCPVTIGRLNLKPS